MPFLVEIEMGNAPPKELIAKNLKIEDDLYSNILLFFFKLIFDQRIICFFPIFLRQAGSISKKQKKKSMRLKLRFVMLKNFVFLLIFLKIFSSSFFLRKNPNQNIFVV